MRPPLLMIGFQLAIQFQYRLRGGRPGGGIIRKPGLFRMFAVFQVTIFQFQGGQAEIGGAAGRFQGRQGLAGQGFQMFGQGRRGPFPQGRQ